MRGLDFIKVFFAGFVGKFTKALAMVIVFGMFIGCSDNDDSNNSGENNANKNIVGNWVYEEYYGSNYYYSERYVFSQNGTGNWSYYEFENGDEYEGILEFSYDVNGTMVRIYYDDGFWEEFYYNGGNTFIDVYDLEFTKNNGAITSIYKIQFNVNGGTNVTTQIAKSSDYIELPNTTRNGYTFDGWYSANIVGDYLGHNGDMYEVKGNATLYARWSQSNNNTGTVKIDNSSYSFTIMAVAIVNATNPSDNPDDWDVWDLNMNSLIAPLSSKSYILPVGTYIVVIIDDWDDSFSAIFNLSAGQTRTVSYNGLDDLVLRSKKAKQNTQLLEAVDYLQMIKNKIANGETKLLKVE